VKAAKLSSGEVLMSKQVDISPATASATWPMDFVCEMGGRVDLAS